MTLLKNITILKLRVSYFFTEGSELEMATTITNTKMVFNDEKSMKDFMDRVYSNKSVKNEELKRTSKNIKRIKTLNINGKSIEVSR